jgi:hypothetical protein
MNLIEWALQWGIPAPAVADLQRRMGLDDPTAMPAAPESPGRSEAAAQMDVRLEASEKGMRLWRNNVGAAYMDDGSFLRYGLANDSKTINAAIKSADLIGIRPIVITPAWLGSTIGQFVSREIKKPGWRYTGTDRERAQLAWANTINSFGGDAQFATGRGTL